ncbi:hypothetical protein ACFQJD_16445 [Haloplanus sp. GCM10025708]|uniref:DUF7118 family protein n=1 Tax=Haloferacaceae TaxID=1644056 RepID=UPI00361050D7
MTDLVTDLADAYAERERAEDAVDEHGEDVLREVESAYRQAMNLLERYEGRATGTGDFAAYVEFQEKFVDLTESLDSDLPAREAFERANDHLDQRRLSEDDFDHARDLLEPAADLVALLEDRTEARERYREAERDVERRVHELDARVAELERLQRLGDADLDAPVSRLRDPIEAYNDAVRDAFDDFRSDASAREVFDFVAATESYPLVEFRQPPTELREYVETRPAGEESITTLLEYADYSTSKLDHYVEDAGALKTRVAVHRTYLERLDADPLTVSWPPPESSSLRYRAGELVSVVARFAPDSVVAKARTVRDLPDETDYERLREAAQATAELDEAERERLASGEVAEDLDAARAERDALEAALADYAF